MWPPEQTEKSLHYPLNIDDHQQMETEILKPATYYTTGLEGRKSKLFKFIGQWFQVSNDYVQKLSALLDYSLELYLAYDDLLDSSPRRRNRPSMFTLYGVSKTILGFEYGKCRVAEMLEQLGEQNVQLIQKLEKMFTKIFTGFGLEMYQRAYNNVPTEEEDFQAAYFVFCPPILFGADVLAVYGKAKNRDMKKLLTASGLYMHLYDDYRNLHCANYMETKGFCDDIREGKCTFPIIHAVNNFPEESKIIRKILKERTDDVEKKRQCLAILEKCGSFKYTKDMMDQILQVICEELDKIDDRPPMLKKLFQTIVIPTLGDIT